MPRIIRRNRNGQPAAAFDDEQNLHVQIIYNARRFHMCEQCGNHIVPSTTYVQVRLNPDVRWNMYAPYRKYHWQHAPEEARPCVLLMMAPRVEPENRVSRQSEDAALVEQLRLVLQTQSVVWETRRRR